MKKSGIRLLLSLALIFIVAQVVVPREAHATQQVPVESLLLDANHERDYISERNMRTAVPAEFSLRIVPPSARTSVWRGRTHASGTSSAHSLTTGNHLTGWAHSSVCMAKVVPFTSRAVDYYIYALRHITI